jgi:hypothetical protein
MIDPERILIETMSNPVNYSARQIRRAMAIALNLDRLYLVLCEHPDQLRLRKAP